MAATIQSTAAPATTSSVGGAGNDTYYVDSASDTVTELAGEGYDIVLSTAQTYALAKGSYVEELAGWLGGAFSGYNLTGNEFDNVIRGGNGTNTLYGLAGNDTLYSFNSNFQFLNGGIGDDVYFVHSGATVIEDAGEGYDTAYALQDLISLPALSSSSCSLRTRPLRAPSALPLSPATP